MTRPCQPLRDDLVACVLKSDCVTIQGHSVQDCLTKKELMESLPAECQALRLSFSECKRSMLDMRRRFRGPKTQ
ncbi:Dephospho-CoA kinase (Dephosphocoenzyme A kinase) (COAE) [Dimargaris verticillata]|uniref:Dephospho-CoA kinase (Dephosphocoenzyme A kinase) (COAE) n=1 Tax=Dimargaris verticillata TaxID=2761393 RepID=A0A9W8EDP0_9FUNG|nr:Dephospho-CoA kinase (Dephosphocoenzyme A kinase) (COAE) [Dimargaris verticillata]